MNLRNVYPKRIGPIALTTSAASVFFADKRYVIERMMFTNITAADDAVTVYIVAAGSSPAESNKICGTMVVPLYDVVIMGFPVILNTGDSIYAFASTASTINMTFNVNDVELEIQ